MYRTLVLTAITVMFFTLTAATQPSGLKRALAPASYDPLALARSSSRKLRNLEATVPPQCYTQTEGVSNPCWTCHTRSTLPNQMNDHELQEAYAFSEAALTNAWSNLFVDRSAQMAAIDDAEILNYIQTDNYTALRENLEKRSDYKGYVPDLDFAQGFDEEGFARDGSAWRAFRYKPFPGDFWPTNGSSDDVLIRLPKVFRTLSGEENRDVYKANLSLLEAAIAAGPEGGSLAQFHYPTEKLDERSLAMDLDGDGKLAMAQELKGFPARYLGDASAIPLQRYLYPEGTEFLHSVRYLDPDAPSYIAARMKELRYGRKIDLLDTWAINNRYEKEYAEKEEGHTPVFKGDPELGLHNGFGWQLQGFIEDEMGLLRLQTYEEHQACMGCHSAIGVTVDQTFALARKLPGLKGWAYQSLEGMTDVPQQGHSKGEIATYLERVRGADPFRANDEMLARFFDPSGQVREQELGRAAAGGDKDIAWLLLPSRERALALNKAYLALVQTQSFNLGRETLLRPAKNVHRQIANGSTALATTGKTYEDGRLWLRWEARP